MADKEWSTEVAEPLANAVYLPAVKDVGGPEPLEEMWVDATEIATGADVTAAISAHEAAANPHPGYLTQAEGDAAYSALGHTHTAANVTDFSEAVDDRVAALLTAGTNITLTYDDGAGTLTIAASGGGGFDYALAEAMRGNLMF